MISTGGREVAMEYNPTFACWIVVIIVQYPPFDDSVL
jgi:hypothetical protein